MQKQEFKVGLVGPAKSGKTAFVRRLAHRERAQYAPTLGVEVTPVDLDAQHRANIWDCGGEYIGLGKEYIVDSDLIIVFGDDDDWIPTGLPWIRRSNVRCLDDMKKALVVYCRL
tara:strand:- start:197 stop:538 length:342 start_codon:yes stop_codon:yes gene_type:complete